MRDLPRHHATFKGSPTTAEDASGANTPLFTARPRGRWTVAAILPQGEALKLGTFPNRRDALSAAAVMARACGGEWRA